MKVYEEDLEKQKKIDEKIPSIRERLMSRGRCLIVKVPFADETGEFHVKCRAFTIAEQNKVFDLLHELGVLQSAETKGKLDGPEVVEKFKKLQDAAVKLVSKICLEKDLDETYWSGNEFTSDVPFYIMQYVIMHQNEAVADARLFRGK